MTIARTSMIIPWLSAHCYNTEGNHYSKYPKLLGLFSRRAKFSLALLQKRPQKRPHHWRSLLIGLIVDFATATAPYVSLPLSLPRHTGTHYSSTAIHSPELFFKRKPALLEIGISFQFEERNSASLSLCFRENLCFFSERSFFFSDRIRLKSSFFKERTYPFSFQERNPSKEAKSDCLFLSYRAFL